MSGLEEIVGGVEARFEVKVWCTFPQPWLGRGAPVTTGVAEVVEVLGGVEARFKVKVWCTFPQPWLGRGAPVTIGVAEVVEVVGGVGAVCEVRLWCIFPQPWLGRGAPGGVGVVNTDKDDKAALDVSGGSERFTRVGSPGASTKSAAAIWRNVQTITTKMQKPTR
jgi:hypothetical protein